MLKDFDVLAPPTRKAKIGGEEIDISIIPARVALKFIAFSKKHDVTKFDGNTANNVDSSMLEDMMSIVADICKRSNPKITSDWLLDNNDIGVLMEFIQYIFAPMTEKTKRLTEEVEAGAEGKN
jgi:hypothetical protein